MKRLKFTVPGKPCSKNAAYGPRAGNGRGIRLTPEARDFQQRVKAAASLAMGHEQSGRLFDGATAIEVASYFTRRADSGAATALIKDALEGTAYENDRIVVCEVSWQCPPDRDRPRTEVTLWELPTTGEIRLRSPGDPRSRPATNQERSIIAAEDAQNRAFDARKARLVSSRKDYTGTSAWEDEWHETAHARPGHDVE
jgi:hypothetical protein